MHLRCLDPILQTRSELPNYRISCHLATLVRRTHALPTCEYKDDCTCHIQLRWVQECPLHRILHAPTILSSTPVYLWCKSIVSGDGGRRTSKPPSHSSCIERNHDWVRRQLSVGTGQSPIIIKSSVQHFPLPSSDSTPLPLLRPRWLPNHLIPSPSLVSSSSLSLPPSSCHPPTAGFPLAAPRAPPPTTSSSISGPSPSSSATAIGLSLSTPTSPSISRSPEENPLPCPRRSKGTEIWSLRSGRGRPSGAIWIMMSTSWRSSSLRMTIR